MDTVTIWDHLREDHQTEVDVIENLREDLGPIGAQGYHALLHQDAECGHSH